MKIGLFTFATEYAMRVDDLARAAEERGFESLWLAEHTHIPVSRRTPWPGGGPLPRQYAHTLDPFVSLMAAAAATTTLKVGTGVCLVIQRDPIITAKQAASLDQLSGGRFQFGVGAGWNAEEMENHGTDFTTRFKRLEEYLRAITTIWTEDEAEYHGRFVDFDPIWCYPKPAQKPHPPIHLGGAGPHTLKRVVALCDGWIPLGRKPEAVFAANGALRELAARSGRDLGTIERSVYGAQPERAVLDRYEEAGFDRVLLPVPSESRDAVLPQLDRYAAFIP